MSRNRMEVWDKLRHCNYVKDHLATICANQIQPTDDTAAFTIITTPTPLQRRAFEHLGHPPRLGYM